MGLPCGIWSVILGLIWLAKGGQGDTFHNPLGNAAGVTRSRGGGDDILDINKDLVPQEAPESSFLMEGDIVKMGHSRALSVVSPRWLKRKGVVRIPYILSHVYDAASMAVIQEAFADFARFTCVKFVPRSYQKDFISILPVAGCFSSVGRAGGMQVVSLDPACLQRGKGVALHELMHVVGFWHEHSRADRDKYIKISWNDILTGFEVNFMKAWTTNMLVGYDYSSILHYGRYAFSRTGWPTITPLADPHMALGQRHYLSHSDIARVNRLYKCSQTGMELETSTARALSETTAVSHPGDLDSCLTERESKIKASSPGTHPVGTAQQAASNCPRAGTVVPSAQTMLEGEEPSVSQFPAGSLPLTTLPSEGSMKSVEPIVQVTTEMGFADASTEQRVERDSVSETTSLLGTEALEERGPTEPSLLEGKTHPEVMSHYVEASGKLDTTRGHTETPPGELGLLELTSPGLAAAEIGEAWLHTMGRRDVSPFLGSVVHLLSNLPSLPIPTWTSSLEPESGMKPPTELAATDSTAPLGEGEGEKWTTSLASNKPTTAPARSSLYEKESNSWMASTQETLGVSHDEMRTTPKGHGQDMAASGRLEMAMPVSSQATALVFSESWAANPTEMGVEGAFALQEKGPSLLSGGPKYLQVGISETRTELGLVETTKTSMYHHTSPTQPGMFSPGMNMEATMSFSDPATSLVARLSRASDRTEMRVQDSVSNHGNKTGLTRSVPLPIVGRGPSSTLLSPQGSKSPRTALNVGTAEGASSAVQLAVSSASRWRELKEKKAGLFRRKKREQMYTLASLLAPSTATEPKYTTTLTRELSAWGASVVQAAHPGELGTEAGLPEQKRLQNVSRPATTLAVTSATEQATPVKVMLSLESSANVLEWGMEVDEGITRMRGGQAAPSEPAPKTELGPVIRTFVPRVLEKWTLVCEEEASSQVPTTNTQAPVATIKKPFLDMRPCYGGPPAKQTLPLLLASLPRAPGPQELGTETTKGQSPCAWSRPGRGYGHDPVAVGAVGLHGDAMERASPGSLAGYAEVVTATTTTHRQVDAGETPSFLAVLTGIAKMETTVASSVLPLEALVAQHHLAPVSLALPHGSSMLAEGSSRPSAKTAETVNGAAHRCKKTWSTAFAGAEAQRPVGWPRLSRTSIAEPCQAVPKEQMQNSPKDVPTSQSDPRKKGYFHAPTPQAWPPQGVWHSQSTVSTAFGGFPFRLMTSTPETWPAGSSVVGLGPLVPGSPGHGIPVSHGGLRRGLPSTEQHQTPLEMRSLTATPSLANKWLTLQALTNGRKATPNPPGIARPILSTEGAHDKAGTPLEPMVQEQSSAGAPGGPVILRFRSRRPLLTPQGRLITLAPASHSDATALSIAPAPLWPSTAAPAGGMSLAVSLPWHLPGPADAMPSIPQVVATPGLPLWQGCNFEQSLCGWWQSVKDDRDWVLVWQSLSAGASDHSRSDPSCSPSWGTINVYLQYEGSPAWHRVWSAKGQQSTGWQRMTMETFRMQRLQVVLEGVLGPDAGSVVHIDDVAICGALCLATCARQLQLCTSPN
ncbi:uncharacterized protein LOC102371087 isoform X1 [Alligator sinensis]|uniref:Metalloendopeptidase n=1 Tax=Alligator sinensis TaxID=38654 RepID=A0A1U7SI06_ALLSI|nr:uncharacterized protein LOC102371087 isoform X1 [Alligator sinensis]